MPTLQPALWSPTTAIIISDSVSDPVTIAQRAIQLRERERNQIAQNIESQNFELASTFVWMRAMALLKKQLASLGAEFVGELLQRPDFDEDTDIRNEVSDSEAISLASDLGILSDVQTMRLLQSQQTIAHFTGIENDPAADHTEVMTREEAISCLRVCVQGVLGHERVEVAEDFKKFREKLAKETFSKESPEVKKLISSPYFFVKTAISIILALFKTTKGAQLEHTARNASVIVPEVWTKLKDPERWQIGQTYALEFNEGHKEAVKGLHSVLLAVSGFDYVPENLRSNTFIEAANAIITAHQGIDNFSNEVKPAKELANLGTSIPGPALASCITAVLCIKLGNTYGKSWAAESHADKIINNLSPERWLYYINERLPHDRLILSKLSSTKPQKEWVKLVSSIDIDTDKIKDKIARQLIVTTIKNNKEKISAIGETMLKNTFKK